MRAFAFAALCGLVGEVSLSAQQIVWRIYGTANREGLGGNGVLSLGDVNGDGVADFVASSFGQQAIHVYSGATGQQIWSYSHPVPWERFGAIINSGGDINGDGVWDLIVGAPDHVDAQNQMVGATSILSGADGALLRLHDGTPTLVMGSAGPIVGDVDGDGFDDYMVFPNDIVWVGYMTLHSGRTGLPLISMSSMFDGPSWGAPIGDVDSDGFADLLLSEFGCVTTPANCFGAVACYSGRSGALLYRVYGDSTASSGFLGLTGFTGGGEDIDGDGVPDFVASMDTASTTNGPDRGAVRAFSGANGAVLWTRYGPTLQDRLGVGLSMGDDWNGDGRADVIAMAFEATPTIHGLDGASGADLFVYPTGMFEGWGTRYLTVAGDMNGDGLREILTSGNTVLQPVLYPGIVYVLSVGPGPTAFRLHHGRPGTSSNGHVARIRLPRDPRLGTTADLRLAGAAFNTSSVLLLGAPVAIDMTPFGATGSTLFVDPFWVSVPQAVDANGMTRMPLPVPLTPSLTGVVLQAQWAVVDPAANPAGVVLSDALKVMLGS